MPVRTGLGIVAVAPVWSEGPEVATATTRPRGGRGKGRR